MCPILHSHEVLLNLEDKVNQFVPWTSREWHDRYLRFSAHLGIVYPHIPPSIHLDWFRKVILNHHLMAKEESELCFDTCQWTGPVKKMQDLLAHRPSIICTFHSGSYRLINTYFTKNEGYALSLLASRRFVQSEQIYRFVDENVAVSEGVDLQSIVAEESTSALKILRSLKAGRHLLGYLDGNLGVSTTSAVRDPRMSLDFLGLTVKVRYGLALLAHRADVPLICIIARRTSDLRVAWHISQCIERPSLIHSSPIPFAQFMTKNMYSDLVSVVESEPWQWDRWLHFDDFLF